MASKNIFNSVKLEQEELGKFLSSGVKNSLESFSANTTVVGSTKLKLDPICPTKLKPKKK